MNSLHPYRAFSTISGCGNGCTDSGDGRCVFQGTVGNTCDLAKAAHGITNIVSSPQKLLFPALPIGHKKVTRPVTTTQTPKLNATGSASIGAGAVGGTASVGAGAIAPAIGSASFSLPSLDNITQPVTDFFNSVGVPPDVFGISTPILLGLGVGGLLILLLVLR